MKDLIIAIVIVTVIGLGLYFIYAKANQPKVSTPAVTPLQEKVNFPKGGENLKSGQTYKLSWSGGGPNPTHIFLINSDLESQGESLSTTDRLYNIPNNGSFEYPIPVNIKSGRYKFEIGTLESKIFNIVNPNSP